jgi:hypothetical protein
MEASSRRLFVGCSLAALLAWTGGCNSDTGNNNNQQQNNNNAVFDGGIDANVQQDASVQQDANVQQDAAVQPDAFVQPDAAPIAVVLNSTHNGWGLNAWQYKNCYFSGCHVETSLSSPPHTVGTGLWQCGSCHGGNGACDPNGDTKTDHTTASNCMSSCHGSHHGYNANAECVGCHITPVGGNPDCTP